LPPEQKVVSSNLTGRTKNTGTHQELDHPTKSHLLSEVDCSLSALGGAGFASVGWQISVSISATAGRHVFGDLAHVPAGYL